MKSLLLAAAVALSMSCAAFADPPASEEQAAPHFTVLEENARLPFANRVVSGYNVAGDNSLILHAGPSRYYRATLWPSCARDLRWSYEHIGLDTHPNGTLDRLSTVHVRGRTCPIETLDRIERPARGATGY